MNKKILLTAFIALVLLLISCGNNYSSSLNIKLDLDNRGNTFENLYNFGLMTNDDENIYFASIFKGLYKFNIDSSETTELIDVSTKSLNVLNGWIYYVNNDDNGIYKVTINGSDNQKISEVEATRVYVQDNILYAKGIFEGFNNNIYVMDIDGNDERLVSVTPVNFFYVYDDFIYYNEYAPYDSEQRIGRMRLDGSEQEIIVERYSGFDWFTIQNNNLFYIYYFNLYKLDLTDFSEQKVLEMEPRHMAGTRNIYQNKFYYTTHDVSYFFGSTFRLHSFDLITHETTKTTIPRNKQSPRPFYDYIIGDKIFRTHHYNGFLMMNLDGSDFQLFPD